MVYKNLAGNPGIPEVYKYIPDYKLSHGTFNILVMQLLGPSLEDLFQRCKQKFSLKTTLQLAIQLTETIEKIHSASFIHRDLKPDNFLFDYKTKKVYIVDFGLAKRYRDPKTHLHIPYRENKSLTGTPRYASINMHLGIQPSRRDDLESLDYILLYFLRGALPWQGFKARTKKQKYQKIMEKKLATPIDLIHKGFPEEFRTFAEYGRCLRFADKPDYPYLARLFKEAAAKHNIKLDDTYDWDNQLNTIQEEDETAAEVDKFSQKAADAPPPNRVANSSVDNTKNPGTKPEDV
jgi:serine/threonine protein kinase